MRATSPLSCSRRTTSSPSLSTYASATKAQQTCATSPADEFWRMRTAQARRSPRPPLPHQALHAAFIRACEEGFDAVCCVTISSSLSATYQAALAGAAEAKGTIDVRVIDSRFATMGEGLLVLDAAERAVRRPTSTRSAEVTTAIA